MIRRRENINFKSAIVYGMSPIPQGATYAHFTYYVMLRVLSITTKRAHKGMQLSISHHVATNGPLSDIKPHGILSCQPI